jgi:hypothetical protein
MNIGKALLHDSENGGFSNLGESAKLRLEFQGHRNFAAFCESFYIQTIADGSPTSSSSGGCSK